MFVDTPAMVALRRLPPAVDAVCEPWPFSSSKPAASNCPAGNAVSVKSQPPMILSLQTSRVGLWFGLVGLHHPRKIPEPRGLVWSNPSKSTSANDGLPRLAPESITPTTTPSPRVATLPGVLDPAQTVGAPISAGPASVARENSLYPSTSATIGSAARATASSGVSDSTMPLKAWKNWKCGASGATWRPMRLLRPCRNPACSSCSAATYASAAAERTSSLPSARRGAAARPVRPPA